MPHGADDELAGDLAAALGARDAVPDAWREAARGAFAWRTVDEELLALTYDSREDAGAAVRGATAPLVLEFGTAEVRLEVELSDREVMGRLHGEGVTEVVFESADGRVRSATPDESGFFALDGEDHGLVRFSVGSAGGRLVTEWIVL